VRWQARRRQIGTGQPHGVLPTTSVTMTDLGSMPSYEPDKEWVSDKREPSSPSGYVGYLVIQIRLGEYVVIGMARLLSIMMRARDGAIANSINTASQSIDVR
jgi:hypothetical protein